MPMLKFTLWGGSDGAISFGSPAFKLDQTVLLRIYCCKLLLP